MGRCRVRRWEKDVVAQSSCLNHPLERFRYFKDGRPVFPPFVLLAAVVCLFCSSQPQVHPWLPVPQYLSCRQLVMEVQCMFIKMAFKIKTKGHDLGLGAGRRVRVDESGCESKRKEMLEAEGGTLVFCAVFFLFCPLFSLPSFSLLLCHRVDKVVAVGLPPFLSPLLLSSALRPPPLGEGCVCVSLCHDQASF